MMRKLPESPRRLERGTTKMAMVKLQECWNRSFRFLIWGVGDGFEQDRTFEL